MARFAGFGIGKNGSATGISGVINTYAPMTATANSTTVSTNLSVAVGDYAFLHQTTGTGNYEMVRVLSTGSGQFTVDRPLTNSYISGAQAVKVPQYTSGTISGAVTATSFGSGVGGIIALVCNGTLTITGSISVNGGTGNVESISNATPVGSTVGGFHGGYGRVPNSPYSAQALQGMSNLGAGNASTAANGTGGGGGKITQAAGAGGGGGGHANAGSTGGTEGSGATGGVGGSAIGDAALNTIYIGGGGGGSAKDFGGSNSAAGGGSGGGIIYIAARTIDFSSSSGISVNGGNGAVASDGSGGGAGGSILIEAQIATMGTNKATATGGTAVNRGGAGSVGRIHLDYFVSYSGTTSPSVNVSQSNTLAIKTFTGMI